MSDVLAITVPIGTRYASVNNVGAGSHRAGKKSKAYKDLYEAVYVEARLEINRVGWEKATSECMAIIVRYIGDRRRRDATNAFKCEADALTAAGVWEDDSLVNPFLSQIRYQVGASRLAIVVVKLYSSVTEGVMPNGRRGSTEKHQGQRSTSPVHVTPPREGAGRGVHHWCFPCSKWKPGDPIPEGHALLNGKLVTRDIALEKAGVK
jgi:Holliday junction resolvase RusA-like endonuclease